MAEANYCITSFLGGEWSQSVQGRFDRPDYKTAMRVCLNAFPLEEGAWTRRPGTQFLGTTRSGGNGRLYTFDFKQNVPYAIEFTDDHIRFWAGNVLVTNSSQGVSSISTASPALVTTGGDLGLNASDNQVTFTSNAGNAIPPLLINRQFRTTKQSATTFFIFDGATGAPIDGSTLGAFNPFSAFANRIFELSTSYVFGTANDWANVQIVQAELQGVMLNGGIPQLLQVTTLPTPTTPAVFTISAMDTIFKDGPYFDAGTTLTATSILTIQAGGGVLITAGSYPDPRATGFVAADVGRHIRVLNEPPPWGGSGSGAKGTVVTLYQGSFLSATYWLQLTAAATTTPGTNSGDWEPLSFAQAAVWTWGTIASIISSNEFNLDVLGPPLLYSGAGVTFNQWQLGLYGNAFGWPTCGVYHEGRLWLSGVIDNRVDSSMSNDIFTFSPSGFDGSVAPNNAISAIFNSNDVNATFWMNSDDRGILCGTQGGEWLVSAPSPGAMSPTNIRASRPTKIGCANIEPRRCGNTLVFVQRHQRKVQEYFPDVYSGRLTSPNLTGTAKHLTGSGILELAGYQQELAPILWARMGDGSLKAVTYKRENLNSSQGPNFAGWHRHALGSGRTVVSLCMGSTTGNLDNLMMVSTDGTVHHVEMMTDIFEETDVLGNAWFLDDAVVPVTSAIALSGGDTSPYGGATFSGLWHLNGKTVQVFAGGLDLGDRGPNTTGFTDFVVANGSVFVPFGDGISAGPGRGLFTNLFLTAGGVQVVAGFTYNSDGQIVRPMTMAETGARTGPAFSKISRGDFYGVALVNTLGISIGADFDLLPALFRLDDDITAWPALTMFSGIFTDQFQDDYSRSASLSWRVSRPWPATVTAVGNSLATQDQ